MKALKPTTPRAASSSRRSRSPGTSPPHSAKSTRATPVAAATLASNAAPSIVGGIALSGMSIAHVVPPAASAAVPVAKPSQSARPGSLRCTWASTTPGSTSSPRASISSRAGPLELGADGDDRALGHRDVALVAADQQVEVAHRAEPADERVQHVERDGHVGLVDRLVGMVADPAGAAHEEHRDAGQRG